MHYIAKKKNSVLINEPYKFDSNLILASSNFDSTKKGYKTAGTTIHSKKPFGVNSKNENMNE